MLTAHATPTARHTYPNMVKATPVPMRNKATGDVRNMVAIPLPPRRCHGWMERLAVNAERAEYTTEQDCVVLEYADGSRIARKV